MDQNIYDKQTIRWWDWPAVLLLMAAMLTVATRLNATHWTEHLTLVQTLAFLGTALGLALGYSRFSPGVARLLAFLYGLILIVWQLGLTLGEGILWPERMVSMGNRLLITLDQLFRQKPVTDNLFFLSLMAFLFWSLCVYAGYSLTRYANPWRAVLRQALHCHCPRLRRFLPHPYLVPGGLSLPGAPSGSPPAFSQPASPLEEHGHLPAAIYQPGLDPARPDPTLILVCSPGLPLPWRQRCRRLNRCGAGRVPPGSRRANASAMPSPRSRPRSASSQTMGITCPWVRQPFDGHDYHDRQAPPQVAAGVRITGAPGCTITTMPNWTLLCQPCGGPPGQL
jgi:hypothetical protein